MRPLLNRNEKGARIHEGDDLAQSEMRYVPQYAGDPRGNAGRLAELQRVDLRYSNGFSVRWQQVAVETTADGRG